MRPTQFKDEKGEVSKDRISGQNSGKGLGKGRVSARSHGRRQWGSLWSPHGPLTEGQTQDDPPSACRQPGGDGFEGGSGGGSDPHGVLWSLEAPPGGVGPWDPSHSPSAYPPPPPPPSASHHPLTQAFYNPISPWAGGGLKGEERWV